MFLLLLERRVIGLLIKRMCMFFQVMEAAFSQEGKKVCDIKNSYYFCLLCVYLFTWCWLIWCSKKVGNKTQTVVNSTQVAAGETSSRSFSRGFCASVMILVTCVLLPFWWFFIFFLPRLRYHSRFHKQIVFFIKILWFVVLFVVSILVESLVTLLGQCFV